MNHIVNQPNKCFGCTACYNICPVGAITMVFDEEGFSQPVVEESLCVNCGKCINVCPIDNKSFDNFETPEIYGFVSSDEIVSKSSSGGVFTHLALDVLRRGGRVVGAAFQEDWLTKHIIISEETELEQLRFSKYMQSSQDDCYTQVGRLLRKNIPVLYSGCPCQIAGLKGYLKQSGLEHDCYQNLITVDLLCHGIPSPIIHLEHLRYLCDIDSIEKFEMRSHTRAETGYYIHLKDGSEIERVGLKDYYINAFLSHLILRRSCHGCVFSRLPRQGDVTIGDFWDAKTLKVGKPFEGKSSIVLINSEKGQRVWHRIMEEQDYETSFIRLDEMTDVTSLNHNIYRPSVETDFGLRNLFFQNYKTMSFEKAVAASLFNYDVGLCLHMSNNYGSTATNYALYHAIEKLGHHPIILDNLAPVIGISDTFMRRHLEYSGKLFEIGDWKSVRDLVDIFVLGSDQSLNWDFVQNLNSLEFLLLSFTHDYQRRIAYSPSFGDNRCSTNNPLLSNVYRNALARFQYFSVREDYSVKMSKNLFHKDAVQVLDPVFLLKREEYEKLAEESAIEKKQKYLCAYILEPSPEKEQLIHSMAKEYDCKVVIIGDAAHRRPLFNNGVNLNIGERMEFTDWLACFSKADRIVTDSFHGVCFSLLFNKPFIGIKARQTHRFDALYNLIASADANNNVSFYSKSELKKPTIEFSEYDGAKLWDYLDPIIQSNRNWLQKALDEPIELVNPDSKRDSSLYDSVKLLKQTLLFQNILSGHSLLSKEPILEIEFKSKTHRTESFCVTDVLPETNVTFTEQTTRKGVSHTAFLYPSATDKQKLIIHCLEDGKLQIRLKGTWPADVDGYSIHSKVRYKLLIINEKIIFNQAKYASFDDPIVVTKKVSKGSIIAIVTEWTTDCVNDENEKTKYDLDSNKIRKFARKVKRKAKRVLTNKSK